MRLVSRILRYVLPAIAVAVLPLAVAAETGLPKVLLIGDSISGGYQKEVKRLLDGKAVVVKNEGNAQYTGTGVKKIEQWLGDGDWDVIHFNWGLWDMYGWEFANEDRSPQAYAERLEKLVTRLEKTGATLIWATTTPACPEPEVTMKNRFKTEVKISPDLEKRYLDAAGGVMKKHGVRINDLHSLIRPDLEKYATGPDNVHFTGAGYGVLARQVVAEIEKAIAGSEPRKVRSFASMQKELQPSKIIPYKTVGDRELTLHLFHPDGFKPGDRRPAYVVIHGGGWVGGDPRRFYPYAQSLVPEGYVGISVEYRLAKPGTGVTVFDCVKDGRAAIRYIRAHAAELGIDPKKIGVGGGSAGGHVALGTALFDDFDHADEDLSVSCRPDALVLLFAVLDTSSKGYGNARVGKDWKSISPLHRIRSGMPPTLVFHGDRDNVAPEPILMEFVKRMKDEGNVCELVLEKGGRHGHINNDMGLFDDAAARTLKFFRSHGLK
ncbi:alpha/beta hydrolase [Haloferula helveola]|uniref:Alpha/beta hydrolase n=1 Tax=Haloferula helveola TaxID=490095 RepID=A0ABM7R6V8_9BACT|nr:alpha/beta hydrolase [Haloferula helveola]